MGSRHAKSSSTTVQAIQPTSSQVAGAPGEPPDFTALFAIAKHMLGKWDGVGDRLQREVSSLTRQCAMLRLHPAERARSVRHELPAGTRWLSVEFAGQIYGTLIVAPDLHDPAAPALPDPQAWQLARICGVLLCLLEYGALIGVLSQHLAPEPLQPLTQRQREVLTLIARGLSDDEIVAQLNIAPDTLRRHRYDIRSRLGIHADRDLPLAAYQYGLVSYIVLSADLSPARGR